MGRIHGDLKRTFAGQGGQGPAGDHVSSNAKTSKGRIARWNF